MDVNLLSTLKPAHSFRDNSIGSVLSSIDFDDRGEYLAAACSADGAVQIYDALNPKLIKTVFCPEMGLEIARFTHHSKNLLLSTKKTNNNLYYYSTFDDKLISTFPGHSDRVTNLEVSPIEDQFVSTSYDNTLKLWDIHRTPRCLGSLDLPSAGLPAYDPTGLVFAVACHSLSRIFLYDARKYDTEPFSTFSINDSRYLSRFSFPPLMPEWRHMEFSNDGKFILLSTRANVHYVLDAFSGEIVSRLDGFQDVPSSDASLGSSVTFAPQAPFIIGAANDKTLNIWNLKHPSHHKGKSNPPERQIVAQSLIKPFLAKHNPRYHQFITGGSQLVFWLPEDFD
ncbi:WD repeat protein [Schizosaccharomyces cryophilus OY26]|uniref:WD repeat protein n=1 Tax=Schizosaccharomyces cryophilus (strain OY26 / ATCC MYA-4695 / CBS 11777 / NBRC 106824 / NRRL Y48691) TaxID=653667 RepID=S9VNY1_SCHCR|nr:WD repeat protein [Schizosaccharomyces cryophilus OY26]EPY49688.1 WD repeat protein [Schizosaccharomyces cryophilus OY26]